MKIIRLVATFIALVCVAATASAKPIPGPRGGRVLNDTAPYAEFFVEKDHTATVTFYDAAMKPVAPTAQEVTVITQAWGKKTIAFAKTATGFASQGKLPGGDDFKITVQLKDAGATAAKSYTFYYEDEACSVCHREKYACICEPK